MIINKKFIKNNKWTILAISFFIVWKFFLINIFFTNESYAEQDTSIYVAHINSVIKCPSILFCEDTSFSFKNYTAYEHLTYRVPLGITGRVLQLNAMEVFYFSFYIGILLILPVLIIFLRNIGFKDDKSTALALFMLSLYNGAGSYHGFFWVVPSFFSLLLYLLIFSIVIGNYKNWKIWIIILSPLALYVHTLSLYLVLSIPFFYFVYYFFTKEINKMMFKKIIFLFFITILFYLPSSLYMKGNPYGAETFLTNFADSLASENQKESNKENGEKDKHFFKKMFIGFSNIKTDYINWVLPNIIALIPFVVILFLLTYYNQKLLLSIYFSTIIFTLLSTINMHAVRFLILLWPLTYIIYAAGFLLSLKFIDEKIQRTNRIYTFKILLFFLLISFSIFNLRYSYLYNKRASVAFNDIMKTEFIFGK